MEKTDFNIEQTRTWQLCGTLEVAESDAEYIVGRDEQGEEITNYAEHVDDAVAVPEFGERAVNATRLTAVRRVACLA